MMNKMLLASFFHIFGLYAYLLLGGYAWINKIALIIMIMGLVC